MTVKELKDKLANLPEDMELVTYHHDMEKDGIMPANFICEQATFRKAVRDTYDDFDGNAYSYEIYVEDENGDIKAILM